MDKIQDWKLESLNINSENGITIAQISRHLLTCDFEDFRIKTNPFHHYILMIILELSYQFPFSNLCEQGKVISMFNTCLLHHFYFFFHFFNSHKFCW